MGATIVRSDGQAPRRRPGRPPPRTKQIAAALRLSAWTVLGIAALVGLAVLLYLNRGDAEGAARVANREIEALLQPGETVEQRVSVQRRRWFDYFRVTHGVLAATDRRLIYVGIPPEDLLPREREPIALDLLSLSYDRSIGVAHSRVFLGTLAGVVLTSGERRTALGVTSLNRRKLDSTLAIVATRQGALRTAADAERRAIEAATAASRRAIYHLVQPQEALASIAARYGTVVDSLRVWNGLTSDHITAGSRLLVRPER